MKRTDIFISSVPHIEGLTVEDFLDYAREKPSIIKYLPDEKDWLHLEKRWICDILYTLDKDGIKSMLDYALEMRKDKIEKN